MAKNPQDPPENTESNRASPSVAQNLNNNNIPPPSTDTISVGRGQSAGLESRTNFDFDDITNTVRQEISVNQLKVIQSWFSERETDQKEKDKINNLTPQQFNMLLRSDMDKTREAYNDKTVLAKLNQIEVSGYRTINQKFSSQFSNVKWDGVSTPTSRSQEVTNDKGEVIATLTEKTNQSPTFITNANRQNVKIEGYRSIDFPTKLKGEGPMHLQMAVKDEKGNNIAADKAVYFTAHYDKEGKLKEMSTPVPVKFMGRSDNAIGYIEREGKIYTLPVTQGKYREMMQEVLKNNGLDVDVSMGVEANIPKAQDRINSTGQTQTRQTRTRQAQTGQTQTRQAQTGQSQARQAQTGQTQTRQDQTGQTQTRQDQTGQPQARQAQTGQTQTRQAQTGQTQTRQAQTGQTQTRQAQTGQSQARQAQTGQTQTRQDQTGQPQARQDQTGQSQARQAQTGQTQTRQAQTGQTQTRQDQTGQSQARQAQTGQPQARQAQAGQPQARQDQTGPEVVNKNPKPLPDTPSKSTPEQAKPVEENLETKKENPVTPLPQQTKGGKTVEPEGRIGNYLASHRSNAGKKPENSNEKLAANSLAVEGEKPKSTPTIASKNDANKSEPVDKKPTQTVKTPEDPKAKTERMRKALDDRKRDHNIISSKTPLTKQITGPEKPNRGR